jgi:hypothetical protein
MNVEIRTEAAQFPEKEYINVIFVAVYTVRAKGMKTSEKFSFESVGCEI